MDIFISSDEVLRGGRKALDKRPSKKFIDYLRKFQSNELSTGTSDGVPSFIKQRESLVAIMRKKYADGEGYHQTIKTVDADIPNFWELILSLDLVSHEIKLTKNLGYDAGKVGAGIYSMIKAPYAEFVIIGSKLKKDIALSVNDAIKFVGVDTERANRASIILTNRILYATLDDGREFRVSRRFRTDMPPYNFINYVLSHPRTYVSRQEIRVASGSSDITELIRRCGFDNQLKRIFFPNTTEQRVYFQPSALLTEKQLKLLIEHKWDKARNGGKA